MDKTICVYCKRFSGKWNAFYDDLCEEKVFDFVTGKEQTVYQVCKEKNKGDCKDFKPKETN
jgi:hypothetical protein